MRGGPVYIVKPKYIFKHPFNKYDLANPSNRQTQNQELTDYFNYGFNEDTMNIYGKLVKRFIQVLDHHKNLQYFNEPTQLMRLNDQIPMDFGGFGKFHDPWIVDNETAQNFHDGQTLMRYFIMMIYANASRKVQYPLIQYIKNMYTNEKSEQQDQDDALFEILQQIGKNLQQKYQQTMKKLEEKANQAKNPAQKKNIGKQGAQMHHQKDSYKQNSSQKESQLQNKDFQEKRSGKTREKSPKKQKIVKKESSDESESDNSSDSSESSSQVKGKKAKDDRSGSRKHKDQKRSKDSQKKKEKKQKKDKHKSKKVKKEKSYKRSKSRDRKKKHH